VWCLGTGIAVLIVIFFLTTFIKYGTSLVINPALYTGLILSPEANSGFHNFP
jgi:hypothetical protein